MDLNLRKNWIGVKMTNADKIRNMSDDELVEVFMDAGHDFPVYCNPIASEVCDFDCGKCCLEWLKEESNDTSG